MNIIPLLLLLLPLCVCVCVCVAEEKVTKEQEEETSNNKLLQIYDMLQRHPKCEKHMLLAHIVTYVYVVESTNICISFSISFSFLIFVYSVI